MCVLLVTSLLHMTETSGFAVNLLRQQLVSNTATVKVIDVRIQMTAMIHTRTGCE